MSITRFKKLYEKAKEKITANSCGFDYYCPLYIVDAVTSESVTNYAKRLAAELAKDEELKDLYIFEYQNEHPKASHKEAERHFKQCCKEDYYNVNTSEGLKHISITLTLKRLEETLEKERYFGFDDEGIINIIEDACYMPNYEHPEFKIIKNPKELIGQVLEKVDDNIMQLRFDFLDSDRLSYILDSNPEIFKVVIDGINYATLPNDNSEKCFPSDELVTEYRKIPHSPEQTLYKGMLIWLHQAAKKDGTDLEAMDIVLDAFQKTGEITSEAGQEYLKQYARAQEFLDEYMHDAEIKDTLRRGVVFNAIRDILSENNYYELPDEELINICKEFWDKDISLNTTEGEIYQMANEYINKKIIKND